MEQKHCEGCSHQNDCKEVYQRLSNTKGESVLAKTVLALLLPLIIFIITAAACEKLLANLLTGRLLRVLLSVLSGIIVVSVYIVIIKIAARSRKIKNTEI